jgi:hypothetical protein
MPKARKETAKTPVAPPAPDPAPPAREGGHTVTVTRETLDATPAKALQFLRGVGTIKSARRALKLRGYTLQEQKRGWSLLHRVSGFTSDESDDHDGDTAAAMAEVDAWDEPNFALADACLKHRHPAQHAFVFKDLRAARGAASLLSVTRFLDRLDALEGAPDREATRAADRAALATLAQRGIDAKERARLRALLAQAEALSADDGASDDDELTPEEMDQALRDLRAFYEEWTAVARLCVTRRDYLIRLGLARRRDAQSDDGDDPVDPKPA